MVGPFTISLGIRTVGSAPDPYLVAFSRDDDRITATFAVGEVTAAEAFLSKQKKAMGREMHLNLEAAKAQGSDQMRTDG